MKYFWRYLEDEPKTIFAGIKCFLYWFFLCVVYENLVFYNQESGQIIIRIIPVKIALYLIYGAISEEAAFRAMPFILCLETKKQRKKTAILLVWIIFSGLLFGLVHYFGVMPISIAKIIIGQGVGGLILGLIYLKFGGLAGKVRKPFLACSLFHWLYNIVMYCFVIT